MFRLFEGLGQALREPNQSLAGLNIHPSIIHLKKLCELDGRFCRLGFGENLSVKVGTSRAEVRESTFGNGNAKHDEADELDLLGLLLMLNLHPDQALWEEKASKVYHKLVREGFGGRLEPDEASIVKLLVR